MPTARSVRITRPTTAGAPPTPSSSAPPPRANGSGRQRSLRSFLLFLAPLAAIYVGLTALLASSPAVGLRNDALLYELFSGLFVAMGAGGFLLTVPSAPRWVRVEPDRIVVMGWAGRPRVYPRDERLRTLVVERHGAGLFSSGATEHVLIAHPGAPTRRYLVEEGLLPAEPAQPSSGG
jgi:hypothetical protein